MTKSPARRRWERSNVVTRRFVRVIILLVLLVILPGCAPVSPTPTVRPAPVPSQTRLPPLSGSGGGRIAFASKRDGNYEIYAMNADGTDQRRLTYSAFEDREPVWSPDGTQITFSADRYGTTDIYVMNVDGSNVRRLTDKGENGYPSWSPDGSQIIFSKYDLFGLYAINADGTGERRLAYAGPDTHIFDPEWSPDGTQIACVVDEDPAPAAQQLTIYVLDVAGIQRGEGMGSGRKLPRVGDELNDRPRWSPDGMQIAFSAEVDGRRANYVVNADGTGLRRLTQTEDFDEFSPAWSPDGERMAVQSNAEGNWDICITDADGTRLRRLTTAPENDADPDWHS